MTTRDRIVLGVVVALAALAAYWFLLLAPKRAEVTKLGKDVATERQNLQQAQAKLAPALTARRAYGKNYATVARLGQAVPADDNVPSLMYQLDSAAGAARVDFRDINLTGSASSAPAPTPAPPSSSGSSGSGSSTSSSGSSTSGSTGSSTSTSTSTTSAAPTQAATAGLPPGATVGPAGFPTMPFSLTFDGSFFHMADFFRRVERLVIAKDREIRVGGRLLTLDGVSLTAGRKGFPQVKATLAATAYLVPTDEGVSAGASPAGPAATPASSSSSSSSGSAPAATIGPVVR